MTRIKICGITNLEDALLAAELGVDALGFIFASSPRKIDSSKAEEIAGKMSPFITLGGVFVNETIDKIREVVEKVPLDFIQLHGEEGADFSKKLSFCKVIKTIRVKDKESLKGFEAYKEVRAFLLDTYIKGKAGGTGKTFDWRLAREAKSYGKPIILSGGLTPENVCQAIAEVKPYSVDASSGVESSPGKKDREKLKAFIKRVRET